ncbi:MAG: site-specific DNA-methyltransferase [Lachnospiraceae bacterium]|nr:site-specific DNA-methyltransferase [Lachnospiraceae bacterium]
MDYQKTPKKINDIVGDNVRKLAEIFPFAVKDGEVDFEALREELGQFTEVGNEKYELTWAGKKNAKKIAQEDVVGRTLKFIPQDSKNADTTENLYIEGDNLEVLKLLRQNYYGSVKMIYIDPPYNTGNDFVYNDSFVMDKKSADIVDGVKSKSGESYTVNKMSQNRFHANWLNMIYPRLKIAKDFLTEDGVIFVSIDDNEYDNLKLVCDEIFGRSNFVANIVWKSTAGSNTGTNIITVTENILLYAKNISQCQFNMQPILDADKYVNRDEYYERRGGFILNKLDRRMTGSHYSEALNYPIEAPDGTMVYPGGTLQSNNENWNYRWSEEKVKWGLKNGYIVFKKFNDKWNVYFKQYLNVDNNDELIDRSIPYQNVIKLEQFGTTQGTKEIMDLLGNKYFDYAKPSGLIKYLVKFICNDSDLILDFFSGSATTAHAIMSLNAEENKKNRYILVQLPEECNEKSEAWKAGFSNICEIGKERIRRAGEKIKQEHLDADVDIGFKVFREADTNIKWNSLMDIGQIDITQLETSPDTIDFMPNTKDVDVVYELMLRQRNVPLSSRIERMFGGGYSRTFLYADSYLVCLETKITEELIDKLAGIDPLPIKFIFRDSAFQDDIALKDETFRRLRALIEKNSGMNKMAYTVEFI